MSHPLNGRSILVTGAEGTIGRAVCARLSGLGAKLTGLSLAPAEGHPPPPLDRCLHGDVRSPEVITDALQGIELVVHLAAIPHPMADPALTVFATNTDATFNVLWQAAEHGIGRAVIASSINHTGLPYNVDKSVRPAYFPIDENLPSQLTDPYALSKVIDEITAATVHRRFGMDIIALRFPYTSEAERIAQRAEHVAGSPGGPVAEGWSYLDVRDAAQAVEKALIAQTTGVIGVYVAADDTLAPYPTEELLDRYAPGVLRTRTFAGREVPIDLTRARTLLGFRAEHPRPDTDRAGS